MEIRGSDPMLLSVSTESRSISRKYPQLARKDHALCETNSTRIFLFCDCSTNEALQNPSTVTNIKLAKAKRASKAKMARLGPRDRI